MKPQKIVYKNQKQIHNRIIKKIKSNFLKNIKEAYLIGSLASEKFGKYVKKYEGYNGSDIDIVIIPKKMSKKWKYKGKFFNWHKAYTVGIVKVKDISHPINFMIPSRNNLNLFWKKASDLNWKVEKLK